MSNHIELFRATYHKKLFGSPESDESKAQAELVDEQCVMFEAEPGVEREVWIWKPKSMNNSNNACLFFAHGGASIMFHPKDFRSSMI